MPDPKYGLDILIILMGEDTLHSPFERLLLDDSDSESGALEPVLSFLAMPSLKDAILAELETFLQGACRTEKTVISVGEPMRYILN